MSTGTDLRYVYAVTRPAGESLPAELRGVADALVRTVRDDDLVAVVSAVPVDDFDEAPLRAHLEDLAWLERTARAHERVVDAVASSACAIPLRLATVYRDDAGVRRMLGRGRERFVQALERLDGRIEWGVKAYAAPGPSGQRRAAAVTPAGAGATAETGARQVRSGRDYLRERLKARRGEEAGWERAADFARRLHTELSRHAEDARLHRPQDSQLSDIPGRNILNAAYLVPRESAADFADLVRGLGADEAADVRVELTGPWAPYSFAESEPEQSEPEPDAGAREERGPRT